MGLVNFKNQSKNTTVPPEILLNNRIDKDIKKMMCPVNWTLSFFLASKYSIKDDYIVPKGKMLTILSFCCIVFLYGLSINRLFIEDLEDTMGTNDSNIITYFFAFFITLYCAGFTILFILNIVHSDLNISIILLIQKIYKGLDFSDSLKMVISWNWISILSAVSINVSLRCFYGSVYNEFNLTDLFLDITFVIMDVNLVYAILLIVLLRKYLEKWIEDVSTESEWAEIKSSDFYDIYTNILEAYKLYKNIFHILILFHTVDTFFRGLCYIAIMLQILKSSTVYNEDEQKKFSLGVVVAILWLAKDIFLVIIQCVHSEKFYITIEEAETACVQRLKNKKYIDCEEEFCSNVIQINQVSFTKMTACGLFYVDASLPLQMMSLLTNYIIVMLQSAFL